jgi:stage II sporulation protein D
MRIRDTFCLALVALTGVVACARTPAAFPTVRPAPPRAVVPETLSVRTAAGISAMGLEDYVLGSVLAEVSPVNETAAATEHIFEIQAVIARTYATSRLGRHRDEGFDFCSTTHCQVFDPARLATSRFAAVARAAVERTAGRILTYGARPVEALFHSDCGGVTASADTVWGGPAVPYLRAQADDVPEPAHRPWQFDASIAEVRDALAADARTNVGRTLARIEIAKTDASGRASELTLSGERALTVRGDTLRAVLNRRFGDRAIQSTRLSITRAGTRYVFEGTGFGHGVGLCQRGAAARVRRGDPVPDILRAYYPGTTLQKP